MLRVSPVIAFLDQGGREMEKIIMRNTALVEELAGSGELEELFRLDASESGPEDDEDDGESDDDEFDDEDDEDGQDDEDEDDEGLDPDEIPHG